MSLCVGHRDRPLPGDRGPRTLGGSTGQPARAQVPTPPSTTWSTSRRRAAEQAGAPPRCADRTRRSPRPARPRRRRRAARGGRGRARGPSPGCARRPTPPARARRAPAARRRGARAGRRRHALDARDRAPPRARRSSRPQEAGDAPHADRRREPRGAARVVVVAADEHHVLPRSATQASLVPKPARSAGDADRAGDVRLVELERPCARRRPARRRATALDLARRERVGLDAVAGSGPRLSSTMRWKFGGCGPSAGERGVARTRPRPRSQQRVVRALVADRRRHLEVHPRPAAQRAAEVAGPDLDSPGSASSLLVQRAVDRRARPPPCRPPGRAGRCRRRTASRRSAPPTARRRGSCRCSRNAVCSGRCPGVCSARTRTAPSSSSQPSSNGSCVVLGRRRRGGRGSSRRSPRRAGRGRRRGRRGCASRARARSARRGSARARGTPRCRARGRRRPRRRRPRRRRGRRRSRGRRG